MSNTSLEKLANKQVLIRSLKDVEGGYLPLDSSAEGTGKFPLSKLAKSQALAEEINNRQQAVSQLQSKDNTLESDIADLRSQVSKLHSALKFKGEKSLEDLKDNTPDPEIGDMYTITDGGDLDGQTIEIHDEVAWDGSKWIVVGKDKVIDLTQFYTKSEIDDTLGTLKEEFANFIWADYGTGDDTNDGLTPQTPVKTLEKAAALAVASNRKIHTLNPSGNSTYFEIHEDISNDILLESFGGVNLNRYDNGNTLNGSIEITVKGVDSSDSISVAGFSKIAGKSIRLTSKAGYIDLGAGTAANTLISGNKEILLSGKNSIKAYIVIPTKEDSTVTIKSENEVNIYSPSLNVTKINISGKMVYVGDTNNRNTPYTAANGFDIYATEEVHIYGSLTTDRTIKIRSGKNTFIRGVIKGTAGNLLSNGYPSGGTLEIESDDSITIHESAASIEIANIKLSGQIIYFDAVAVTAQTVNIKGQEEVNLGQNPWYVRTSLVVRAETGDVNSSNGGIYCDHIKGYAGNTLTIRGAGLMPGYYKYSGFNAERVLGTKAGDSYCILEGAKDIINSNGGIRYISKTENDTVENKRFWKVSLNSSHISLGSGASIYGEHVIIDEAIGSYGKIEINENSRILADFVKLSANHIQYNPGNIYIGNDPLTPFNSALDNGDYSYLKCNLLTKMNGAPLVYMFRTSGSSIGQYFHFDVGMVDLTNISVGGSSYFAWVDQVNKDSGIPFTGNISGRVGGFINNNSSNKFRPYPHDYKFIGSNFIVNGLNNTGTISLHVDPYIGPMDLYWDPNFGHDNADGLSKSTAVKTPAGIDKALKALNHSSVLVLHVLSGSNGVMLGNIGSDSPSNHNGYNCTDMNQVFANNNITTLEVASEISPVSLGLKNWWNPNHMMTWMTGFKGLALDMTSIPKGSADLGNLYAETEDLIHMWADYPVSARPLRFDNLCLSAKSGTVKTECLGAGSFIIHDSQNAQATQPYLTSIERYDSTNLSIDAKENTTLEVDNYYLGDNESITGSICLKGKNVNYKMNGVDGFHGIVSIHADEIAKVIQNYKWTMTMNVYAGDSATLNISGDPSNISGSVNCKAGNTISVENTTTNHTNVRLDAPTISFSEAYIYGEPDTNPDAYTETKIKAATIKAGGLKLYGGDFYIDCTELCGSLNVGGSGPNQQPETTLYANIEKISYNQMGMINILPSIYTSEVVKAFIDVKEIEGYTVPSSVVCRTTPWLDVKKSVDDQKTFGKICVYANVQKSGSNVNDQCSNELCADGSEWKVIYLDRSNPSAIQTSLAGDETTKLLRLGEYNIFEVSNTFDKLYVCVPDPKLSRPNTIQSLNLQEAAFEFVIPEGSSLTAESIKFYSISADDYVYVNRPKGSEFNFTPGESEVPMEVSGLEALSGPGDTVVGVVINHRVMCTVFHPASA